MFEEIFLSLKPAEFYLRGINMLADKQEVINQKIMANILLIEINSLLNYFMNKFHFTKMEIIYDSTQYPIMDIFEILW